jgi:cobalt/nickel transport system ATP-binding protein
VLDVLERLRHAGCSVVMSTHDVDLAYRWADTIAVMIAGTVAACGSRQVLHDRSVLDTARLRPPAVVSMWQALPDAVRPPACPVSIEALAQHLATHLAGHEVDRGLT